LKPPSEDLPARFPLRRSSQSKASATPSHFAYFLGGPVHFFLPFFEGDGKLEPLGMMQIDMGKGAFKIERYKNDTQRLNK